MTVDRGAGFPPPPFLIAANHHSFLDPPLIGSVYGKPIRFIGLADLFGSYPILDWALDGYEVIRVRRGTVPLGAMRSALSHLEAGGVVGLFPEGIRSSRFGDRAPLPGAAWLAARTGVPLVAVAVEGTEQVLGVDNQLHRGHVKVTVGPTLRAVGKGREAVDDLTRRWAAWVAVTVGAPKAADLR
jgi:1-acyl-sn-glycerol-3-phosphate acyltransferase